MAETTVKATAPLLPAPKRSWQKEDGRHHGLAPTKP
jgi:hypothetical protein